MKRMQIGLLVILIALVLTSCNFLPGTEKRVKLYPFVTMKLTSSNGQEVQIRYISNLALGDNNEFTVDVTERGVTQRISTKNSSGYGLLQIYRDGYIEVPNDWKVKSERALEIGEPISFTSKDGKISVLFKNRGEANSINIVFNRSDKPLNICLGCMVSIDDGLSVRNDDGKAVLIFYEGWEIVQ